MEASADARGPISRGLRSRCIRGPAERINPRIYVTLVLSLSTIFHGGKRFELRSYRKKIRDNFFLSLRVAAKFCSIVGLQIIGLKMFLLKKYMDRSILLVNLSFELLLFRWKNRIIRSRIFNEMSSRDSEAITRVEIEATNILHLRNDDSYLLLTSQSGEAWFVQTRSTTQILLTIRETNKIKTNLKFNI